MTDLTGAWSGVFNYSVDLPATTFVATLRDENGAITGTIDEPDIFVAGAPTIGAMIEGRRDGAAIRFVKYYDRPDEGYDSVVYVGVIAPDGDEISGQWDIPAEGSGTFLMIRERGTAVPVEAANTVDADAPAER